MRVNTLSSMRRLAGLVLLAACGSQPQTQQAATATATATAPTVNSPAPAKAAPAADGTGLAQVREDVPLPAARLLGHTVAEVQALLGEHTGKGMQRESCVRFVPERTFFACTYAIQRYEDKTGTFAGVSVGYEDGVATELAYDGYKAGSGPFTPEALLAAIGVTLPGPGKQSSPAPDVRLWSWFNSLARLKIGGKQYRVEVSVVGDDWTRSQVSVLLNEPLTPEQQAKIKPTTATQPTSAGK